MELGDLFVLIALMTRRQQLSVQFSDSAGNLHLIIWDIFVQSSPYIIIILPKRMIDLTLLNF